jgi:peptidoglycan/LPS O-acetylase OafA/YrhL
VSVLLVGAIVGLMYLLYAHPLPDVTDSGGLVDVLFVPLVMMLAIGTGSLPGLLSTRLMIFGGQISFCLYMVHELVHMVWGWAAEQFRLNLSGPEGKFVVLGLLAIALGAAVLLFYVVEEPARRWMRNMMDARRPVATPRVHRTDKSMNGKLHQIDGDMEEAGPKAMSARAG